MLKLTLTASLLVGQPHPTPEIPDTSPAICRPYVRAARDATRTAEDLGDLLSDCKIARQADTKLWRDERELLEASEAAAHRELSLANTERDIAFVVGGIGVVAAIVAVAWGVTK